MERVIIAEAIKGTEISAYEMLSTLDPSMSLLDNEPRLERLLDGYLKAINNLNRQKVTKRIITKRIKDTHCILRKKALARYQMIRNRRLWFRDFLHV